MSDDGAESCKTDENVTAPALYTLLPVHKTLAPLRCARSFEYDVRSAMLSCRQNRKDRINRDISHLRREKCSEGFGQTADNSSIHSSTSKWWTSYRLLNICLILVLNVICNQFVTYVNCDELYNSVGARGHFTHTWAMHIPGGEKVAEQVAADHGLFLRGKVSGSEIYVTFSLKSLAELSAEIKLSPTLSLSAKFRVREENRV
jgi:hypothetical protein